MNNRERQEPKSGFCLSSLMSGISYAFVGLLYAAPASALYMVICGQGT